MSPSLPIAACAIVKNQTGFMKHKKHTKVLVAGAGPVGMLAAILLKQQGVETQIIDKAGGSATRSYACVLHSRSLDLLRRAGVLDAALDAGKRIDTIELLHGETVVAEISLSAHKEEFPYVLALPQDTLEKLLERKLHHAGKPGVLWNHRLRTLSSDDNGPIATIEKVGTTCEGYGVPTLEQVVESELEVHASFVVGDDGPDSIVRKACKMDRQSFGPPKRFIICDTADGVASGNEARIMLTEKGVGAFWPLPGNCCRWILPAHGNKHETHGVPKDRQPFVIARSSKEKVEFKKMIEEWAPWFKGSIYEIDWWEELSFQPLLAERYGCDDCWIAGDAAHEGGPIGMQSMNAGLADAAALADALVAALGGNPSRDLLAEYGGKRREEWLQLVEMHNHAHCKNGVAQALKRHLQEIPSCLPALGGELEQLLHQLGVEITEHAPAP
jgi:2-polyprenyl-6-methoxyphenol hydroxylase-like FAD-dependent oxidoreductase